MKLLKDGLVARLRMRLTKRQTFLSYATVGVSGIIIDTLVFALLVYGLHVNPALATIISTSCGIINNFIWNSVYTFKTKDHLWRRFFMFYGVGLAGIVASALIVLLFADIFAQNALLVKLLSLPPVVIGQYFVNKHVSFGERLFSWRQAGGFVKSHGLLIAVYVIFALLSVLSVKFTPYIPGGVGAPDEGQHYGKNVEFILDNHRLPVAGKDDQDSLSDCRDNHYGQAVCLYSYQFTPQFSYIVNAMAAKIGQAVGLSPLTGARLASTFWGLVYVTGIYAIARLFLKYKAAVALTAIAAFIPQVIFISSYVSDDIHSLALSTLFIYTTIAYLALGHKKVRWWFFLTFGLLFVCKYNYFVLALVPAILLVRRWWQTKQAGRFWADVGWMAAAALLIGGPWFLRNYLLYHDLTGMSYTLHEMSKHHPLGTKISLRDPKSYLLLFRFDSFNVLFASFFATFGYMIIKLQDSFYTLLKLAPKPAINASFYTLLKLALMAGFGALWVFSDRRVRWVLTGVVALVVLLIGAIIVNAFTYDYQFQGRYLFSTIAVTAAATAYALSQVAKKHPGVASGWLFGGVTVMAVVLLQSVLVVGTNLVNFYGN